MVENSKESQRLVELGTGKIGKMLFKYSLPAVVGNVVMAIYNIIDSVVIGHAIDDPNVVSGIAVTFPVMNLATALGMLIGAGAATRVSIVLGQKDHDRAVRILGNAIVMSIVIGLSYITLFAIFLDPILRIFGASDHSIPYAREFIQWILPGMVLMNLTFSFNNVMRASGYPGKAMYTNLIGAGMNAILAPLFLFGFGWGVRGAAIATDISMLITAFFVMGHFFRRDVTLHFVRGTFRPHWPIVKSILYIGMAPFLINVANASINAIVNNSLVHYGGDNAVAAVVVFNRFVSVFIFVVIGICQGMQPIVGYNYGARRYSRLFSTLRLAAISAVCITTLGSLIGGLAPGAIARMFMQDQAQIDCAIICLRVTTITFCIVGFQVVVTNFFQALGMAGKAIFLSLTRQIIFMIPMLFILPPIFGLRGVWASFPVCDTIATVIAIVMLIYQVRRIKAQSVVVTE